MDITRSFLHYKNPSQYFYFGTEVISVFRVSRGNVKRTGIINYDSISEFRKNNITDIKSIAENIESGVILNSGDFVFNLLNFTKIPFREKIKNEITEWRVQKIFPENMENYYHEYFQLSRNRMFSLLLKIRLKEDIEHLFEELGIELIYFGNSTVEIINNLKKTKKCTDFFIEYDGDLMIVVFLEKKIPFYFRKFRINDTSESSEEIYKTIEYVKKNYKKTPRTYSIFSMNTENEPLIKDLNGQGFIKIDSGKSEYMIIPGQK